MSDDAVDTLVCPLLRDVERAFAIIEQDKDTPRRTLNALADVPMRVRAALAGGLTVRASAVPSGWKLVPETPTQAMCIAAQQSWANDQGPKASTLWGSEAADIYRAMLKAAPSSPETVMATTAASEGWQLVPVQITSEMHHAFTTAQLAGRGINGAWEAALAAARAALSSPDSGGAHG